MEKEPDYEKKMLYFTKRPIYKKDDPRAETFAETEHYAVLWVYEDDPKTLHVNYYCPYCNDKDYTIGEYDPFKPIKFTCKSCKTVIDIPRLRGKRGKRKPRRKTD